MQTVLPDGRRWSLTRCITVLVAMVLIAAAVWAAVTRSAGLPARASGRDPGSPARAVPVVAVAARTADMAVDLTGLGSVVPINTVTVKSRVDGQLTLVRFREGDVARAGDLLAEIDARPFEVQLAQAEGQ